MRFSKINVKIHVLVIALFILLAMPMIANALPAFPGAEGWGADTIGGRSASTKLYKVNTLSDGTSGSCSGNVCTGTLRYALTASGPRIVIFTVAGTIALQSDIWVNNGYVTVAGQTAPGTGVQVRNASVRFENANHVIVRGMKFRPGDSPGGPIDDRDGVADLGGSYVIFDHNSAGFSCDGVMSAWYPLSHVTFSYNLMAYALENTCSEYDARLMLLGGIIDQAGPYIQQFSLHHNLFAHSKVRTPGLAPGTRAEIINNVVYNTKVQSWASWTASESAWIGNYWKNGPMRTGSNSGLWITCETFPWCTIKQSVYLAHSICPNRPTDSGDETLCIIGGSEYYTSTNPITLSSMTIDSPTVAYSKVLGPAGQGAGAYPRDSLDSKVISDVINGTGPSDLCASEECYGGYPTLSGTYPTDSDGDGIPDAWENSKGLNPSNSADALQYAPSGYLWIEEYINSFFPANGSAVVSPIPTPSALIPNPPSIIRIN